MKSPIRLKEKRFNSAGTLRKLITPGSIVDSFLFKELEKLSVGNNFGFVATFFVTKNFIGKKNFCDNEMIVRASKLGMEIGVHGTTHRILSHLSIEEIKEEFSNCKSYLEDLIGKAIVSASLPGGFWNEKIAISAKEAGLKYLFTSKPGINYSNTYLLNLKRIGIRYNTQLKDIQRYCDYKIKTSVLAHEISLLIQILGIHYIHNNFRYIRNYFLTNT